jgi:hypothetical protein
MDDRRGRSSDSQDSGVRGGATTDRTWRSVHGEESHASVGERRMSERCYGDADEWSGRRARAGGRQNCRVASRMVVLAAVGCVSGWPFMGTRLVASGGRSGLAIHLTHDAEHRRRRGQKSQHERETAKPHDASIHGFCSSTRRSSRMGSVAAVSLPPCLIAWPTPLRSCWPPQRF